MTVSKLRELHAHLKNSNQQSGRLIHSCCYTKQQQVLGQNSISTLGQYSIGANTKLHVQEMIREGSLSLIWSSMMDIENTANPDLNRKMAIADWQQIAVADVGVNLQIEALAESLARSGVKPMDALHVACAIEARAEYFLTTDKALLRKMAKHSDIKIVDPVDFIRALKDGNDENRY